MDLQNARALPAALLELLRKEQLSATLVDAKEQQLQELNNESNTHQRLKDAISVRNTARKTWREAEVESVRERSLMVESFRNRNADGMLPQRDNDEKGIFDSDFIANMNCKLLAKLATMIWLK